VVSQRGPDQRGWTGESKVLHTASDTLSRRRWRDRRPPYLGKDSPVVGRWAHAYREGEPATLCALPLELLHWRPFVGLDFRDVAARDRCEACVLLADRP
jgi:hypothetical protein